MQDPVFPAFAGLACLLLLLFLPYQIPGGNLAVIFYVSWIFVATLCLFINSVVWAHTVAIMVPVWGDIATILQVGSQIALPASALAVLRRLERIASTRQVCLTTYEQKREKLIEMVLGVLLPAVYMVLHIVVQGHRYDIVEEFGPTITTYRCWPMLFLYTLPPLLLSLVSLVYAVLALRWFLLRRRQFKAVLQSRSAGLTTSRYIRLFLLCCSEIVLLFPAQLVIAIFSLLPTGSADTSFPLPYVSWSYVHADFGRIDQVTIAEVRQAALGSFYAPAQYLRWVLVMGGFSAFFCLGCTQEHLRQLQAFCVQHHPLRRSGATTQRQQKTSGPVSIMTMRETSISHPSEDIESKGNSYELHTPAPVLSD